jgi:hypothetical protein
VERDLLDRPLAVDVGNDEFLAVRQHVHVERPQDLGDDGRVGHPLPDDLPLVVPPRALHDDPGDVEREGDHLLVRQLSLDELEIALGPEEDVVDRLLRLLLHQAQEVRLGDRVDHHEDLAEEDLRLLLDLHGHLQLLLGDVPVGDEEVAEILSTPRPSTKSVPVFEPSESHCSSSPSCIVLKFPVMPNEALF